MQQSEIRTMFWHETLRLMGDRLRADRDLCEKWEAAYLAGEPPPWGHHVGA
jgi:hypothetical protein